MKTCVIIPARGGSRRLKNKNIAFIWGKPMIYYALRAAEHVANHEDIFVSTDSSEIKEYVEGLNYNVIDRPNDLATDNIPKMDVIRHAFEKIDNDYDIVISLQANSPQIYHEHYLHDAIKIFNKHNRDELFSVDENLMQNAAFRIIRASHLKNFKDFSVNCGVFVCNLLDIHTQADIDSLDQQRIEYE